MTPGRGPTPGFAGLLERDGERSTILTALERALGGEGAAVAIEAPAGVGKTSLLGAAVAEAERRGALVLSARAAELEQDLAFGVVRQLLLPVLRRAGDAERASLLSGPAAFAGAVLGLTTGQTSDDPFNAALLSLHWLFADLSERGPLALMLDDAHWADEGSLRFIAYLVRRLEGMPILLLLSSRPAENGAGVLAQLLHDLDVELVRPAPLSTVASAALVRARLGPDVSDAVCRACHTATGGNPFLLGELVSVLVDEGFDPSSTGASSIEQVGPQSVARSVLSRLARLGSPAIDLARAVAIFPSGAEPRHVAALLGLDHATTVRTADRLADVAILTPGRPMSFLHPMMRSAVYQDMPGGERGVLHGGAARLLRSEAAEPAAIATHLLAADAGTDPAAFGDLTAAAGAALLAGAPEGACRYLDRALDEPVPPPAAAVALHLRGLARMLTGDPASVDDLRAAVESAADTRLRAAVLRDLGRVYAFGFETKAAAAALDEAVEAAAGVDADLAARCVVDRIWVLWSHDDVGYRFVSEVEALTVTEEPDGFLEHALTAYRAFWESWRFGDAARAGALARAALKQPVLASEGFDGLPPVALGTVALMLVDRPAEATAAIQASLDELAASGTLMGLIYGHMIAGMVRLYAGELRDAEADLHLGEELARGKLAGAEGEAANRTLSAVVALERAGPHEAEVLLRGLPTPPTWLGLMVHAAAGRIALAAGRPDRALDHFEAAVGSARANGLRHSLYPFPWRGEMAVAAAAVGDVGRARALSHEGLDAARRFGSPGALGEALRVAGLVRGGDEGIGLLEEAAATLVRSPARLLQARACADLGSALRRANRRTAAREPLQRAVDLAGRCGADRLAAHATDELRASGARPRRQYLTGVEALTPSERRIARLAAAGLTNRQIAQQLFLNIRTVEMHLSSVLAKLGLTSRHQIGTALAGSSEEPP